MISIDTSGLLVFDGQVQALFDKWEVNLANSVKDITSLISQGIKNNLKGQKSFDGSTIAPLKQSTITQKTRLGQPLRVFEATGEMIANNPIEKKISNYEYDIEMNPNRAKVMSVLQIGKSPMAGSRKAFGINKDILKQADSLLSKAIG